MDLEPLSITNPQQIANPSVAALYEDALVSLPAPPILNSWLTRRQVYETGTAIVDNGALTAYSGKKTGRSPLDKRIVQEPTSEKDIWYVALHSHGIPSVPLVDMLEFCC